MWPRLKVISRTREKEERKGDVCFYWDPPPPPTITPPVFWNVASTPWLPPGKRVDVWSCLPASPGHRPRQHPVLLQTPWRHACGLSRLRWRLRVALQLSSTHNLGPLRELTTDQTNQNFNLIIVYSYSNARVKLNNAATGTNFLTHLVIFKPLQK